MGDLFDTNILIDLLDGRAEALAVADASPDRAVSVVTRIEVLSAASESFDERSVRMLLADFQEEQLSRSIADEAARVRRTSRLKLPDAVILATARVTGRTLVTRDAKAFAQWPGVRLPYA